MDVHLINDEVRGLPRCVWLQDAHLGDLLNAVSLLLQEVCPACVMLKPSANVRASFIDGRRPWAASRRWILYQLSHKGSPIKLRIG